MNAALQLLASTVLIGICSWGAATGGPTRAGSVTVTPFAIDARGCRCTCGDRKESLGVLGSSCDELNGTTCGPMALRSECSLNSSGPSVEPPVRGEH